MTTVPDGWKMVPIEPNSLMICDGAAMCDEPSSDEDETRARGVWAAMLAAAPASTSPSVGGEFDPDLFMRQERLSREVWPDDVLDRVEAWVNGKCGGSCDVRTIAAALIAALPTSPDD